MKQSIHQVAAAVLKEAGKPMTASEIYSVITEKKLYEFKAKSPESILRSQLRRHTANVEVANKAKQCVFSIDDQGKFSLV